MGRIKVKNNLTKNKKSQKKHLTLSEVRNHKCTCVLAHNEYLKFYLNVISEDYKPMNISLYRWMHNPPIPDDFKPQIYQENNPNSPETIEAPDVNAPKDVVYDYTDRFTLSNYTSVEDADRLWKKHLQDRLKKCKSEAKKEKEIKKWIENKGQWIFKVDYKKSTSLIGPGNDDIHKQAFMFEGVDPKELIDKAFTPIKIEMI